MSRFPVHGELLPGPPAELCAEVEAAWERACERDAEGLEIRIARDGGSGRIAARVLAGGHVPGAGVPSWRLGASALLAFACGDLA